MSLEKIDAQIAKWKELRSNIALKLVDLDEMPTYLGIRQGLYTGTTAVAVGELGDAINLMWTLSDLWEGAFAKLNSVRSRTPVPWERDAWLNSLESMMLHPVIALPGALDLSDTLQKPTLTLARALTELVNQYDRVIGLIRRIDAQVALTETKVRDLSQLADRVGASKLKTQIEAIAEQVQCDPLGVSLDSFAAIEAQLNRFNAAIANRQAVADALDRGDKSITQIEKLAVAAGDRRAECERTLGISSPIPSVDVADLRGWGQTLRGKLTEAELGSIKVGLAKWIGAIDQALQQIQGADRANQDSLNRYQELVGRFSAAQARAVSTWRQDPRAEGLAAQIRAGIAKMPKDLGALEASLVSYEALLRG